MMRLPIQLVLLLCFLTSFVMGNTESFLIKVPKDFPVRSGEHNDDQYPRNISLENSNNAKKTFETTIGKNELEFIELQHLQVDETYQIKICWSALDPVSIKELDWHIVPHSTEFQDTVSKNARVFIQYAVMNDSYPVLEPGTIIPINVSVVNCKLGIPVDLYKIILYIVVVMVSVAFMTHRINLCGLIRR